jgi:TPR repeat protein
MKKIIFFYILFFYNSESIAASQDIENSDTARAPLRTMKNLSEEELIEIAVRESQKDHEEWQEAQIDRARREEQEALHARWPMQREQLSRQHLEASAIEEEQVAQAIALSLREISIQGEPVHSQIPVEEAMETGNGLEQEGAAAEGAGPEARIRTAQEEAEDPIAMILQKSRQEYEEHQKVVKKEEEELAQALAASILEEQYYNNIRYTHVNWLNEEALSLANIGGEENLRTAEGLLLEALDIDKSTKTRSSMSVIQKKLHVESLNKQALNIRGIGGKENLETAVALLGEALAIEDAIQTWYNFGVVTRQLDPKKSRMCFKIAAERGHVLAQTLYGVMLNQGEGGPKNDTEARKFFQLAANSGEKMSHYNYAIMLLCGYGGAQDLVEGERYMEMASKNESNPQAQYHYGILLCRKGTQESKEEALKYIKKAADKGNKLALETLAKLKKETPKQKASSENPQEPTLSEVVKPQLGKDLEPAGHEPRRAYPKEAPESLEEQDDVSTSTEEEEKEAYEGVRQMGAVFPAKPKKTTSEREQAKREINRKKKIVLDALRQGSREEIAEARKKLTDIDDSTFRGWVRDAYEKIGKERTKIAIQAIRQKALEGEANLTSSASAAPLDRADERKKAAPKSRKKLDKKTENAHQRSSPQTERAELSPQRNTQFYPLTYSARQIAEHMTDPGKPQAEPKVGVQKEIDDLFENMKQNWHAITGLWGRLGGSFDQSGGSSHGYFTHPRFGSAHGFGYHMHGRDGLHPGLILDLRSYILLIGYRPSNFSHELECNS